MYLKHIFIENLGCPKNLVDSEKILKSFLDNNYQFTPLPEDADVILVNTCGFIDEAVVESIDTILEFAEYKKDNPDVQLVVAGCMSQRYKEDLVKELPEVDLFTGSSEIEKIPVLLNKNVKFQINSPDYNSWNADRILMTPEHYAYIKIAEGCSANCAFCIIPKLRGSQRSNSIDSITKESITLVKNGIKELVVVAQDTIAYGRDKKDKNVNLYSLLLNMVKIDKLKWLRLLYLYPEDYIDKLLNLFGVGPLLPYVDMPIQHINDKILKLMNRRTKRADIEEVLQKLRKIDDVVIRTSVIVGFPGESEEMFQELVEFVKEQQFDYLGIFKYHNEEGTLSYNFANKVDEEVIIERWNFLNRVQEDIVEKKNMKYIGDIVEVIIEELEDGYYIGRAWFQAPEIDGIIRINSDYQLDIGKFYFVEIIDALGYNFEGKIKGGNR